MAYEDTGWIEIKPVVLLFGENSSGKSAIVRALRFLKQSMEDVPEGTSFIYNIRDGIDLGNFDVIAQGPDKERYHRPYSQQGEGEPGPLTVSFAFRFSLTDGQIRSLLAGLRENPQELFVDLHLKYVLDKSQNSKKTILEELSREFPTDQDDPSLPYQIFHAEQIYNEKDGKLEPQWWYDSHFFYSHEIESFDNIWPYINLKLKGGFIPNYMIDGYISLEDVAKDYQLVNALQLFFRDELKSFLAGIKYLPPLRRAPQREYVLNDVLTLELKRQGLDAFRQFLAHEITGPDIAKINYWIDQLGLGNRVEVIDRDQRDDFSPTVKIELFEQENSVNGVNVVDMGVGVSQILPIIVVSVLAESGSLVMIEQPELHLHPRLQVKLGEFFAQRSRAGVHFLIETHSEHLFLRFRNLVAKATLTTLTGETQKFDSGEVLPFGTDEINAYFVCRETPKSYLYQIHFKPNGYLDLKNLNGPRNHVYNKAVDEFSSFFVDDGNEVMDLADIYLKLRQIKPAGAK